MRLRVKTRYSLAAMLALITVCSIALGWFASAQSVIADFSAATQLNDIDLAREMLDRDGQEAMTALHYEAYRLRIWPPKRMDGWRNTLSWLGVIEFKANVIPEPGGPLVVHRFRAFASPWGLLRLRCVERTEEGNRVYGRVII